MSGIGGLRIGARGGARAGAGRPAARPRNPQAAVYWRRRFVALVIGLGVLALIGWAFSGAVGGGGSGPAESGPGSAGSGQPGSGIQGGAGSSAGSASPREAGATAGQGGARSRTARLPSCYRGDVVLSLFSSQSAYSSGELPQFTVDVVTTARQTCTFNVGADHIALVIRTGSTQVWSSTDCVQGAGNLVSDLQRGVPTVVPISWNLEKSSPGCPAAASRMPAGTYTAVVIDGALQSNSVTFRVG